MVGRLRFAPGLRHVQFAALKLAYRVPRFTGKPLFRNASIHDAKYAMGQSVPKFDVRVMSAYPPITTKSRTSRKFGSGPLLEVGSLFDNLVGGSQ
jgi:hypothetical protein